MHSGWHWFGVFLPWILGGLALGFALGRTDSLRYRRPRKHRRLRPCWCGNGDMCTVNRGNKP